MADEYIRKEFLGGAPATTIPGGCTSGATSLTIASGTGQPTGSVGKFVMVIDRGLATEEKVLVTTRTTTTLNSVQRGYDGTTAQAHSAGAVIQHCIDAYSIDQANAMTNAMTAQYDLVMRGAAAGAYTRIPVGANGQVLAVTGGVPGFATLSAATLADGVVTTAKLADNSVTSAKIVDGTIATADIADDQITKAKMAPTNHAIETISGLTGSPETNDFGFDTYEQRLYHYNGSAWRNVGAFGRTYAARARMSAAQSVNNVTNTVIAFDAEDFDTDTLHSTSTNNSRITVPSLGAGLWAVGFYLLTGAGTGVTASWITVNGGGTRYAYYQTQNGAANGNIMNSHDLIALAAGDYIEVNVYQNSGGAINIGGSGSSASFHAHRVSMGPSL